MILYHLKITIHVYIYISSLKQNPRYVSCKKISWSPGIFFREPLKTRIHIPKVVGHTRLIQITSATFGALLVPFHTVTMLPIEACVKKEGKFLPETVIVLWVIFQ